MSSKITNNISFDVIPTIIEKSEKNFIPSQKKKVSIKSKNLGTTSKILIENNIFKMNNNNRKKIRYKIVKKNAKEKKIFRMKEQKNNKKSRKNRKRKNNKKEKKEKILKLEREVQIKMELLRKARLNYLYNNNNRESNSHYSSLLCYRKNVENYFIEDFNSDISNYKDKLYEIFYGNFVEIKKRFKENLLAFNEVNYSFEQTKHYYYKRLKTLSNKNFNIKNAVLFNTYYNKMNKVRSRIKSKDEIFMKMKLEEKIINNEMFQLKNSEKVTQCVNGVVCLTVATK